jgi:ketosteroid isomerase-like protein
MAEESTTPDLVERWQQASEAAERGDFDAVMSVHAPEAVWDASQSGVGSFEGVAAIRSFLEDWIGAYEGYEYKQEEGQDLGNGVVFVVVCADAHPVGSSATVQERWAVTVMWAAGMIVRVTVNNGDADEARAIAERLAEERVQADA